LALPASIVKEVLLKNKKIGVTEINSIITKATRANAPLCEMAVTEGLISSDEMANLIAQELGVTAIDLPKVKTNRA